MSEPSSLAERLQEAFWAAASATFNDESVYPLDMPYFDQDTDTVDGHLPSQFWLHMADWWERNGKW